MKPLGENRGLPLKSHQMNVLQVNVGTYVGTVIDSCHRGLSFSALGDVVFIPRDGLMAPSLSALLALLRLHGPLGAAS